MTDSLAAPLQYLKGVGPRKAADLKRAGLATVEDLLYRLPFRYEDRSRMQPIATLRAGNKAAVFGEIKSAHLATTRRRGFRIFHAVLGDASGAIRCSWMNQAYLADIFTLPGSLAGLPGMSVPVGTGEGGMPVGLQLIGNYFKEGQLLHAAHALQQATDWHLAAPSGF